MPDDADELILKLQHLEAQAREGMKGRDQGTYAARLKTRAQQMAFVAQQEVDAAAKALEEAEAKLERARQPGMSPLEAADLLVAGRNEAQDWKGKLVKARARLNFALDQMDEAERREWDAVHAEARAEAHGQMADDPLFNKPPEPPK